jgi:hypothetical protein
MRAGLSQLIYRSAETGLVATALALTILFGALTLAAERASNLWSVAAHGAEQLETQLAATVAHTREVMRAAIRRWTN